MAKLDKSLLLKIQQKLESDNKMIFLVILASIIVIYLDFIFLTRLQLSGIKNLEPEIVKLKKDLGALGKDLLRIQGLKDKQIEKKDKALLEAKKIISEEYTASLLQDVSDLANKNEIRIIQMKLAKESQSPKQENPSAAIKFASLLITLDLLCDYHRLGEFINDLENAQIFIAVQNIKIASQPNDFLRQKVNLVLRTYVRK